jgi:hypothetical protein
MDEATELLREVEWVTDDDGGVWCPICHNVQPCGHKADCRLAAFLAKEDPPA